MDEQILNEVRQYMDRTMNLMGSIFSHFRLTISVCGQSAGEDERRFDETDFALEMWPVHKLSTQETLEYIQKHGLGSTGTGHTIMKVPLDAGYEEAFETVKKAGRELYYTLRREYPIRRQLNWPYY